ncbi:UNVERIFIED_CONTAM: putative acyl-activating enzyme 1, peroxisomal [Sesamum radiatum]|uniref:Acyl-activating enzyme 1, peroxisomal n=1 Tax=Sesamum radiatum TaxID=300843 RepID=A0AAW2QF56_SESRA
MIEEVEVKLENMTTISSKVGPKPVLKKALVSRVDEKQSIGASLIPENAFDDDDRVSVVHGDLKFTWKQTHDRCVRLASALSQIGISRGDVVAALAPNIPEMYELHFAVPMAGAVLCSLNIRHDSGIVCQVAISSHDPRVPFALSRWSDQPEGFEYESFLARGKTDFAIVRPNDECDPIALNYTSGTTSSPKGVVYSHRGAYLNSLSAVLLNEMLSMPVYLWTVPMFHCNGWCLTWAVAAQGGTNVCLRNVTAKGIFDSIATHQVTHMGGAPTVLNMIINAPTSERRPLPGIVSVMTGASPPPPQVLFKMEELGFNVTHSYGLTETYGPGTVCAWKPEWNSLPLDARAKIKSRQGVQHIGMEEIDVKDPATMQSVPADAKTIGEVMFRGNTVMNGYLKDIKATQDAFRGGWFHSGDLGVKHPDGYIELKDRSKDIIISGGENISTIEVESVIFSHPAVLEAAVVGRPDDHWGETPCAFVKLKDGFSATAEDIIKYCRDRLPRYMAPRTVVFEDLPKTSTGKTQVCSQAKSQSYREPF